MPNLLIYSLLPLQVRLIRTEDLGKVTFELLQPSCKNASHIHDLENIYKDTWIHLYNKVIFTKSLFFMFSG